MKKRVTTVGLMASAMNHNRMISFWRDQWDEGKHYYPSIPSLKRFMRVIERMDGASPRQLETIPNRDGWIARVLNDVRPS